MQMATTTTMRRQRTNVGEPAVRAGYWVLDVVCVQVKYDLLVAGAQGHVLDRCHAADVLPTHEQTVRQVDFA